MNNKHVSNASTESGGINDVAGYYISACCRSDVFLQQGERRPRCPACGSSTQWGMTLWRSWPVRRKDGRRSERHTAPEAFPRLLHIEWGGFGLDDIRVVNYSSTGIAVEVPDPAIFFGEVTLTLGDGAPVSGRIRHCRPKDTLFVLGIACDLDLRTMGLEPPDAKAAIV